MFSASSSNYFFNRSPQRFGSRQDDYLHRVNDIVTTTANRIRDAVNEESDLIQLFHDTLHSLGSVRHCSGQAKLDTFKFFLFS